MSSTNPTIHIYYKPTYPPVSISKLLQIYSEYGPIKKSNTISSKSNQHVAITFLNAEDATQAMNANDTIEENGINYKISIKTQDELQKQSRNRVILRNLSFYANQGDIKNVLEGKYGIVNDVHLPMIPGGTDKTHRGFAFVVFEEYEDALNAVKDGKIVIKKRECSVEFSESKEDFTRKKQGEDNDENDVNDNGVAEDNEDDGMDKDDDSVDSSSSSDSSTSSSDSSSSSIEQKQTKPKAPVKNAIFLHNLPYTITRKCIEELFPNYNIEKVFFPKDGTGQLKGSAFVYFDNVGIVDTLLELYKNGKEGINTNVLSIQGRTIQVSKPFSNNISSIPNTKKEMDKRHLYLQHPSIPSRPNDDDVNIPQSDKQKRLQSKKDRNIKLKSPLFVINPKRLSIRNLSKTVTSMELRELIGTALKHALDNDMVNLEDVVIHYQAEGYSLNQIQYDDTLCCIPEYNEKSMNKFIRNVQILKDDASKNEKSKGFAFVDFEYHIHALAVLRQLDNNIQYSKQYALGGNYAFKPNYQKRKKKSNDNNLGYPRLIVEFAVENKAKMMKHEISTQKKLLQRKEKKDGGKKRKSRGQKQREQKRKKRLLEDDKVVEPQIKEKDDNNNKQKKEEIVATKKPPKKKKTDAEAVQFDSLVSSYKKQLFSNYNDGNNDEVRRKRWFEEDD